MGPQEVAKMAVVPQKRCKLLFTVKNIVIIMSHLDAFKTKEKRFCMARRAALTTLSTWLTV